MMEMTRQEKEIPKEANFGKAVIPKGEVPFAKVRKSEVGSSSTTKGSKEQSHEPNGEEEKKMRQDLVQNLERMLNEQNEYITTLREEHNDQTLKQRWTLERGDAWGDQTADMKNRNTGISVGQDDLYGFFWIRLGIISYVLVKE